MNSIELQNDIIRNILFIKDEGFLSELDHVIKKFVIKHKGSLIKPTDLDEGDASNYATFEEWDTYLQSLQEQNPDEFLPDWGMTNIELRKYIWDSEHSGDYIPVEKFFDKINSL